MNGTRHLVLGLAVGVALAASGSHDRATTIGLCAIGSLLPDLDEHGSMGSKLGRGVMGASVCGASVLTMGVVGRSANVNVALLVGIGILAVGFVGIRYVEPSHWLRHRGPLHSFSVMSFVAVAVGLVMGDPGWGWPLAMGWLSHLYGDAPTWWGLPLFWPLGAPRHRCWKSECNDWHVTPRILRYHSGNALVEWPLVVATGVACNFGTIAGFVSRAV